MDLMSGAEPVVGLLLCEVGNLDDLCDEEAQCRVEDVIAESFAPGCSKSTPTFYWSGETVTAWLPNQQVHPLPPLTNMKKVHDWRYCERLVLTGAAEHGHPKLLVYNTHQPASDNRKYSRLPEIVYDCLFLLTIICYYLQLHVRNMYDAKRGCLLRLLMSKFIKLEPVLNDFDGNMMIDLIIKMAIQSLADLRGSSDSGIQFPHELERFPYK